MDLAAKCFMVLVRIRFFWSVNRAKLCSGRDSQNQQEGPEQGSLDPFDDLDVRLIQGKVYQNTPRVTNGRMCCQCTIQYMCSFLGG